MPADVQQAWSDYQESIESLYGRSSRELIAADEVGIQEEASEEAVVTALERSAALGVAIQENLDDPGVEQRELAILQLSAAAVVDLSVANDLALNAAAGESPAEVGGGGGAAAAMAPIGQPELTNQLASVTAALEASPAEGIWAAIRAGGSSDDSVNPRDALEAAVDSALAGVCGDAAEAGSQTFRGLIKLPGTELADAASKAVAVVFGAISDEVGHLLKRAVRFLLKGLEKLLALFGSSTESAFKKVVEWADGLGEDGVKDLLERLYGSEAAKARLRAAIQAAPATSETKMENAAEALKSLETKFGAQMNIVKRIAWLVDKIHGWLWAAAPPWSQLGVTLGYLSATAYVVFAGGDYADWGDEDGGSVNFVPGVESIVSGALT
ncbi:MAG TPA: hypothetical protein VMS60_11710 [Solirubrobacterales bacterium]|nr:hypothetical protein [Solirubrobacterales bacterium]